MAQSVLISGASGLVGSAVSESLARDGWRVARLVRKQSGRSDEVLWNPAGITDPATVAGFDAVVHLAGEPVFGLWTNAKKRRIRDSRVLGTRSLSRALAQCTNKPKVMVCASAFGYYGNRGDEMLTEDSLPGSGFLAETCVAWEAAAQPANEAGIRVLHLRTAIVLSKNGGALKTMLPAFKLGIAGPLGTGRQYFPWITLHDLVRTVRFGLANESLSGPINATAPQAVTNAEFTRTLAKVLHRLAVVPVPALVLKLLPGNIAEEALLASARVAPKRLVESGFKFDYPELERALSAVIHG